MLKHFFYRVLHRESTHAMTGTVVYASYTKRDICRFLLLYTIIMAYYAKHEAFLFHEKTKIYPGFQSRFLIDSLFDTENTNTDKMVANGKGFSFSIFINTLYSLFVWLHNHSLFQLLCSDLRLTLKHGKKFSNEMNPFMR